MSSVRTKLGFAPSGTYRPDFSQCVTIALQTFAVLIGLSITDFFDASKNGLSPELRTPLFFALMALELRYVFGSAMHLNYVYVKSAPTLALGSGSVLVFLKDMAFLVLFGWLAVQITHSQSFRAFLWWSIWFLVAGFCWSVLDAFWRTLSDRAHRRKKLALAWIGLDGGQVALTAGAMYLLSTYPDCRLPIAWCLVLINGIFLVLDFRSMQEIFGRPVP